MPTTTPNRAIPIAALGDTPDANVLASAIATALDNVTSVFTGTIAARPAATSTAGTSAGCPGTFWWASDIKAWSLSLAGAWIDFSGSSAPPIPIGGTVEYAGAGDPSDARWLLADGRAISRSTYATLFTALGTTYGAGDGSTTFNIPDLRGRVAIGPDNMGTAKGAANRVLASSGRGNSGGEERHVLTTAEMPSHGHVIEMANANWIGSGFALPKIADGTTTVGTQTTDFEGGGSGHQNMQPYVVINKIIRVL